MDRVIQRGGLSEAITTARSVALTDAFARGVDASRTSATVAWFRYFRTSGIDPKQVNWASESLDWFCHHLIAFMCFEIMRGMSPVSVVTSYLSHIGTYFAMQGVRCWFSEARKDRLVNLVAKGLLNRYHKDHPKSGRAKLAFSLAMTEAVSLTLRGEPEWLQRLVRLSMRLGIWYLLRKGEYFKTSRNRGGVPRSCLKFADASGRPIVYAEVGLRVAASLHLSVKFSKTDRHGYGRLVAHQRQSGKAGCIVKEMEEFIAFTRDQWFINESSSLFVWPDGSEFTADEMAGEMKSVALVLGCDPTKVSAHSCRYGGASLLASFGLPQYLIEYFGGWAKDSKTLPLYAQPDASALAIASGCFGRFRMSGEIGAKLRELGFSG